MHIAVVFVLMLSSVCGQIQIQQNANHQVAFTNVEPVGGTTKRHFFVFTSSVRNYAIRNDGRSEATPLGARRQTFWLRMGGSPNLERVYFAEYEGDLLLEYEVSGAQSNWGYILRVEQKSLKIKWVATVSADNLGPGLIDDHELYFGGSNLLSKLDLQSGSYVWQSELQKFFTFSVPAVRGDKVVFHDESEGERTVEVEKETGRLVKS